MNNFVLHFLCDQCKFSVPILTKKKGALIKHLHHDKHMIRARKFGWQDTYVFTKAMGEMMINKMRGEIPVVIMRPSVIESTCKEPFPGWMEGNRYFLI